ncbi:hypothetical protein [Absidia glauca]|uniref:ERT1/acuK family PAS domain-containing protein n=1 Tax=Absidia glauca TaxID=4829 RepID=A0A163J4S3_ABSGL|nr:hypothetical protein [Absidia glauca]
MYLAIHSYFLLSITIQVDLAIAVLNEAWHLLVPMELGRKQSIFKILMNYQHSGSELQSQSPIEQLDTSTFGNPMTQLQHPDTSATNLMNNSMLGLDYGFGSSAANLEYSMLSNMLNTTTPYQQSYSPSNQSPHSHHQLGQNPDLPNLTNMWSSNSPSSPLSVDPMPLPATNTYRGSPTNTLNSISSSNSTIMTPHNNYSTNGSITQPPPTIPLPIDTSTQQQQHQHPQQLPQSLPSPSHQHHIAATPTQSPLNPVTPIDPSQMSSPGVSSMSPYGDGAVVTKVSNPTAAKRRNQLVTPQMAYSSVNQPFSYAEGYHYLVNYVRQNMSREDLMRISRALALFRPSVLASMMNLTTDDLIFTEKCLQRTLLEYEKLITYSGTPTVVWRRTGEIALVGKEFSLLTQWPKDTLMNKKTYIYELMSHSSAIEYWEQYALHAFDNTDSAVYSSCILVSPTKRVVPCTFCFTIKRDIFDLPSVIVGNFLPILR